MRARRYRLLLNVIDHLGRDTHYGEAIALDKSLVDPDAKPVAGRPSMREWSPVVELLAAIYDRLNGVIQIQSEKDLRLKPWPSPVLAADLAGTILARRQYSQLSEKLFPPTRDVITPESRGFWLDTRGRWHRADGRYVSAAVITAATSN